MYCTACVIYDSVISLGVFPNLNRRDGISLIVLIKINCYLKNNILYTIHIAARHDLTKNNS